MSKKPTIIITGASGFIGTNLLELFLLKKYNVTNIDIEEPRNKKHIPYWKKVDICDYNTLKNTIDKINPNYVVHLAARTNLNENNGLNYYSANIYGVKNLIKIISDIRCIKRVVFTSSMLVNKVGYKTNNLSDYNPETYYGKSKVIGEQIVFENAKILPEFCVIRPTSIWGEWFKEPYKDFFNLILNGNYFHPGNRASNKTFGYVGNAVYQIDKLLFADNKRICGNIFYIGDQPPFNISEWSNNIACAANVPKPKKLPYFIFYIFSLLGDILKYFNIKFPMTSYRLKNMTTNQLFELKETYEVCGPVPYSNDEGINKTLYWMLNH